MQKPKFNRLTILSFLILILGSTLSGLLVHTTYTDYIQIITFFISFILVAIGSRQIRLNNERGRVLAIILFIYTGLASLYLLSFLILYIMKPTSGSIHF